MPDLAHTTISKAISDYFAGTSPPGFPQNLANTILSRLEENNLQIICTGGVINPRPRAPQNAGKHGGP